MMNFCYILWSDASQIVVSDDVVLIKGHYGIPWLNTVTFSFDCAHAGALH